MRFLSFGVAAATGAAVIAIAQGCSSDETTASPSDAGSEGHVRIIACPPATDAGRAAAADAGVVAKITAPTNGQKFTTQDRVTFVGTGSAPTEGTITDKTRMIWNIGDPVKGVNPDGEGPTDTAGPYAAGTYLIRFDVSNKDCVTAADEVTITVE
jgi:hypothetical protein